MIPTAAVVLLGVVALGSLVQAVFLVLLAREASAIVRRVDAMQTRIVDGLRPALDALTRATADLATVSTITADQARRLGRLAAVVEVRVAETRQSVDEALVPLIGKVAAAAAAFRGLRQLLAGYRKLRGV
jgi:hypothetical protein